MSESDNGFFIILGPDTGSKEFYNIQELEKWLPEERQAFEWLSSIAHRSDNAGRAWERINEWLRKVDELIGEYRRHSNDEQRMAITLDSYKSHLLGTRAPGATILSHSATGHFVNELQKKRGPFVAAAALAYLMNLDIGFSKDGTEGIFWALQYQRGNTDTVAAQQEALEGLKKTWASRFGKQRSEFDLHLRTDADERITMIQTYLALLREGNGPKDDERQLILQTLFRPSSTGFIKEDGPAGFLELVKLVKKE